MSYGRFRIFVAVITLICCSVILGYYLNFRHIRKVAYDKLAEDVNQSIEKFPYDVAVYIKDLQTGVTIKFNEDRLFPSASLVKLPIMAAVYEAVSEGRLSMDSEIKLQYKHKVGGSGILKRNRCGNCYSVRELVGLMVTESDNVATNMLTEQLGFTYLNYLFKNNLNLKSTNMSRSIMDLRARRNGYENYITAREAGELLEQIYRGKVTGKNQSSEMMDIMLRQKIRDRIPKFLPKTLPIAHKTGLMRDACHDAGIIFTSKGDFVVCVLTGDIKNFRLAKNFIGNIAYKAYQFY